MSGGDNVEVGSDNIEVCSNVGAVVVVDAGPRKGFEGAKVWLGGQGDVAIGNREVETLDLVGEEAGG